MGRGVIFRDRLGMDELSAKYVLVSLMLLSLPPRTLVFNTVFFDLDGFEPIVSGVTRDVEGFVNDDLWDALGVVGDDRVACLPGRGWVVGTGNSDVMKSRNMIVPIV